MQSAGLVRVPDTTSPETKNAIACADGNVATVEVTLVALDDCRAYWAGKRVGLLKIDVEGFEREVFAGAHQVLHQDCPKLVMFESLGGAVDYEIASVLRDARYEIFQLNQAGEPDFSASAAQNLFAVPVEEHSSLPKRAAF